MRAAAPPEPASESAAGQRAVVMLGLVAASGLALGLGADNWRLGALFVVGVLLGITLYHAAFGFTGAYRAAIVRGDVSGVVAQLAMLALAIVLFAPALAEGELFGRPVGGAVAPVGVRVALGSFLFGIGMQLGGGCGSGTLFTAGGGNARMVVTLVAFCAGAFIGSLDAARFADTWSLGRISLGAEFGFGAAMVIQLIVLAAIWVAVRAWARGRPQQPVVEVPFTWRRLLRGPWPLLAAGAGLAVLNWATLALAGHAWTITWAFTLWGAKAAALLGWDPASSPFWTSGFAARALAKGVFGDITSVMNIGILLGALTAAGLAGRFAPSFRVPARSLLAAIVGGLMMGYGARLGFGCNIGAFFSGVASFSLHGWLWIVGALAGTWLGIKLRPWFGLAN